MIRKLVAAIACRNQGSRLYGKPLQNLSVEKGWRILDHLIACLNSIECIEEIVLGISEGVENEIYRTLAEEKNIKYIVGDETDVLSRLVSCGELGQATDIFRVTSESPFPYFEAIEGAWKSHRDQDADATFMDDIVDGCNFEIISQEALKVSHAKGTVKHRSELCSLYIRDHVHDFNVIKCTPPVDLIRKDLRLTVDNPEDLAVCRIVYEAFSDKAPRVPVAEIIKFLDANPKLIDWVAPFTEIGYSTMYTWGADE